MVYRKWFNAHDVDGAREEMFRYLRDWPNERVIYYHGWSGLGASAVLRSIAEVLPSRTMPGLCFDRIIHVDCSEWKNRRSVQRAIAEELEFDSSVMAILDKQDEEDDFNGVDESSRHEISSISRKIHHVLKDIRFVVIFHNGSDDEIDLYPLGVPRFGMFELTDSRMLWTFRRRLFTIRDHEEQVDELRYTDVLCYDRAKLLGSEQFYAILCKEAAIIVARYPCMRGINQATVADCCLYKLFVHGSFYNTTKSDWAGHASNYWICDGILQEDITSEISTALHREISWECDASLLDDVLKEFKKHLKLPFLVVKDDDIYEEGPYRWISITSMDKKEHGMQTIPTETSSFSLAYERSDHPPALPNRLFKYSSNLGVLILYWCAFNFASPQFLKCHSLRFLGLDHCTDDKTGEGEDQTKWLCLYSLWVLDLRYTDWNEILSQEKLDLMTNIRELNIEGVMCWQYIARLQGRLPNLQRLRIIKPTRGPEASIDTSNSFLDKTKLEILDLSGNSEMEILPNSLSKSSSLQVLVLDGCNGLEDVVMPDGLPCLLRSFSFDGYGSASKWTPIVELPPKQFRPSITTNKKGANVSKISLRGCTQLENMFIRGLPNLIELDLSGTPIKILDFKTMVVEVPSLKRLYLLGCQHLRAIIWWERVFHLKLLCIDTRAGIVCPRPSLDQNKSFQLQIHAILVDARLARSLWSPINNHRVNLEDIYFNIHVTSSPLYCGSDQLKATCKDMIGLYGDQVLLQQLVLAGPYGDILSTVGDPPMQAFPRPPATNLDRHIEIAEGSQGLESELNESSPGYVLADIIRWRAQSLHVHDVSASASMPGGYWYNLKQCRIERCPKLDTVFPSDSRRFDELETLWVSDLLMARWICSKGRYHKQPSFKYLQHLQLRSCPRLQFVLPVWVSSFPSLETIHIIHCSDLKHIFVLDDEYPEEITIDGVSFPKLTTIHLHDLPMLRQICEVKMVAPMLETIKIRGCWGLRRMPAVGARGPDVKKPTVEIEKDVWEALQWDGDEAGQFEAPIHSRYYKEKLPRVSYLR